MNRELPGRLAAWLQGRNKDTARQLISEALEELALAALDADRRDSSFDGTDAPAAQATRLPAKLMDLLLDDPRLSQLRKRTSLDDLKTLVEVLTDRVAKEQKAVEILDGLCNKDFIANEPTAVAQVTQQPDDEGAGLATCAECGAMLELVRPGKYQHPSCSQALPAGPPVLSLNEAFQRICDLFAYEEDSEKLNKNLLATLRMMLPAGPTTRSAPELVAAFSSEQVGRIEPLPDGPDKPVAWRYDSIKALLRAYGMTTTNAEKMLDDEDFVSWLKSGNAPDGAGALPAGGEEKLKKKDNKHWLEKE